MRYNNFSDFLKSCIFLRTSFIYSYTHGGVKPPIWVSLCSGGWCKIAESYRRDEALKFSLIQSSVVENRKIVDERTVLKISECLAFPKRFEFIMIKTLGGFYFAKLYLIKRQENNNSSLNHVVQISAIRFFFFHKTGFYETLSVLCLSLTFGFLY